MMILREKYVWALALCAAALGCEPEAGAPGASDVVADRVGDASSRDTMDLAPDASDDAAEPDLRWGCAQPLPYASEVVSFTPGFDAGYGQSDLDEAVLGPPTPGPAATGSLDVLSLGIDGEVVVSFGSREVTDGPGADLIVWENPFVVGGDPDAPFAELGEVSVSADGEVWHTFPCNPDQEGGFDAGCAGWRTRVEFDPCGVVPLVAGEVGGDTFDLADLGLAAIRFVRIRDVDSIAGAPTGGFDLDAVGAVHLK